MRERFKHIRAELVQIDDGLFNACADFERATEDSQTAEAVGKVGDAVRSIISILIRVIDALP